MGQAWTDLEIMREQSIIIVSGVPRAYQRQVYFILQVMEMLIIRMETVADLNEIFLRYQLLVLETDVNAADAMELLVKRSRVEKQLYG